MRAEGEPNILLLVQWMRDYTARQVALSQLASKTVGHYPRSSVG